MEVYDVVVVEEEKEVVVKGFVRGGGDEWLSDAHYISYICML